MAKKAQSKPTWEFERAAIEAGHLCVAGIDEAGRGPLAGPVVAAAVVFPPELTAKLPAPPLKAVNDSKKLSPEAREQLAGVVREAALAWGVGIATAQEIDRINILQATHLAARRAVEAMNVEPDYLLTDYLKPGWASVPVEPLVKGDGRSISIAAASILAKTARDEMMRRYDEEYPGYGFAGHKGYPCPPHYAALETLGPCTIHRLTFNGVSWFDVEPRPSKTFEHLAKSVAGLQCAGDADEVRALADSAFSLQPSALLLPECERMRFESVLDARMREIGL